MKRTTKRLSHSQLLKTGLKLFVSIVLLVLLFTFVDVKIVWQNIQSLPLLIVLLYGTFLILMNIFYGWRWTLLTLEKYSITTIFHFFVAVLRGNFYNLYLPSSIGGDLIKWSSLRKVASSKTLITSVLFDRGVGLMGVSLMGASAAVYYLLADSTVQANSLFWWSVVLGVIVILGVIVLYSPLIEWISKFKVFNKSSLSTELFSHLKLIQKRLLPTICLSMLIQLSLFVLQWMIAQALHIEISFFQLLSVMPLIYLVTTIPISFAGFGTTEAAYVFFLGLFGITSEQSLSFALVLTSLRIMTAVAGLGVAILTSRRLPETV